MMLVHPHNCHSHTGAALTIGKGAVYSMSSKQKIYTHNATEAELMGINDAMSMILLVHYSLEAQVYDVQNSIIIQDNESTMHLTKNGHHSSRKQTHHIDIQYYFITCCSQARVAYCPNGDMVADFLLNLYKAHFL